MASPCVVIEKERLIFLCHLLNELDRVIGPLFIERRKDRDGDLFDILNLPSFPGMDEMSVPRHGLYHLGPGLVIDKLGVKIGITPLCVHIGNAQEAVEIVKTDVLRLGSLILAHMPFPHGLGPITGLAEQGSDSNLSFKTTLLSIHGRVEYPVADRESPGHDCCSCRRTGRLGVGRGQLETIPGKPVHIRCRRTGHDTTAVNAGITPSYIIHEKYENVRLLSCFRFEGGKLSGSLCSLVRVRNGRFHGGHGLNSHGHKTVLRSVHTGHTNPGNRKHNKKGKKPIPRNPFKISPSTHYFSSLLPSHHFVYYPGARSMPLSGAWCSMSPTGMRRGRSPIVHR